MHTSELVLADISVRSTRKLFIFIIESNIYRINISLYNLFIIVSRITDAHLEYS